MLLNGWRQALEWNVEVRQISGLTIALHCVALRCVEFLSSGEFAAISVPPFGGMELVTCSMI